MKTLITLAYYTFPVLIFACILFLTIDFIIYRVYKKKGVEYYKDIYCHFNFHYWYPLKNSIRVCGQCARTETLQQKQKYADNGKAFNWVLVTKCQDLLSREGKLVKYLQKKSTKRKV